MRSPLQVWRSVQGQPLVLFATALMITVGAVTINRVFIQPRVLKKDLTEAENLADFLYREELKNTKTR